MRRSLALAAVAGNLLTAVPAHADPSDGKGCVGTPAVPASYVCVVSLTPAAALPQTSTTNIPVTVPPICYFLDCTPETTVNVPVPGVAPGSGVVAVLWYQGQTYPIATGTAGTALQQVVDVVTNEAADAQKRAQQALDSVPETVDWARDWVCQAVALNPTINEALIPNALRSAWSCLH